MWICSNCSRPVPDESKFCPHCAGSASPPQISSKTGCLKALGVFVLCIATLLLGAAGACFGLVGMSTNGGGLIAIGVMLLALAIGAVVGIVTLLSKK